ncbi:MAG TPA: hypothetical protein VH268_05510 [Solirubrobacterales bacterium]|jgi:hypothetical protein|nr:hypothetical protein [Solirubrobacterales bacterium]
MNLHKHLTYANVVSTLCLFLLFGGVAYAGTQLTKGSVGTNALKAEAVTKGKLHPNSVNSKKVVDNSLTGSDIQAGTLGKVPNAGYAENATHATNADTAANAEKLDGHAPGEFGPVLVAGGTAEVELEAGFYFSVSGVFTAELEAKKVSLTLPGHKFKATDFAIHLEGEAQAGISVHASLVINGAPQEVCTLTVVPSTCTPSTATIEIPAGAQVAWKITSASPAKARPQFALRLLPN